MDISPSFFIICLFVVFFFGVGIIYSIYHNKDFICPRAIFFENSRIGVSTVKIYGYYPGGGGRLMHHFSINDIDTSKKIILLRSLIDTYRMAEIFIDATGMGEAIYEHLKTIGYRVKRYYPECVEKGEERGKKKC
jgi:hypothetical protein